MTGPAPTLSDDDDALFRVFEGSDEIGFGSVEADDSAFALMGRNMFRSPAKSARITFRLWPQHRARGLGEAVARLVIDRGFERGYSRLWLGLTDGPHHVAARYVASKVGMREFQPAGLPDTCIGLEIRRSEWCK